MKRQDSAKRRSGRCKEKKGKERRGEEMKKTKHRRTKTEKIRAERKRHSKRETDDQRDSTPARPRSSTLLSPSPSAARFMHDVATM